MTENVLLIVGRWHAVTREQEAALRQSVETSGPGKLVFIITAAEQSGTKRHPLTVQERTEIVEALAKSLDRPYEIHAIKDTGDDPDWVGHIRQEVEAASRGKTRFNPDTTVLVSGNGDVIKRFQQAGYSTRGTNFLGATPVDVLSSIARGADWKSLVNDGTLRVYEQHDLPKRIREIFADVLLTEEGELSTGRDFAVYVKGMEAGLALKITDIFPWILPGLIADKGTGSGKLLVHLSQQFPTSTIVGVDLSKELLHIAESQHYPNHNVSVMKGNIIHQRFQEGSVSTIIYSSVPHELFSYNGYDREQVRLALRNSFKELKKGGRLIIRDGVAPVDRTVWMRCDQETESRFRRFAKDFKRLSTKPGVAFEERKFENEVWFRLSLHDANEFLSKKDYLENWDIEVNEEFGVFTLEQWKDELHAAGFQVLHAQSYLNEWILNNRYVGRVWLHADDGGKPGLALPFPDSTMVLVGQAV